MTTQTSYASIVLATQSSPEPTRSTTGNPLKIHEDHKNMNNKHTSEIKAATEDQIHSDLEPIIQDPMPTSPETSSTSSGDATCKDGQAEDDDESPVSDYTESDFSEANSTSLLLPSFEEDSSQ